MPRTVTLQRHQIIRLSPSVTEFFISGSFFRWPYFSFCDLFLSVAKLLPWFFLWLFLPETLLLCLLLFTSVYLFFLWLSYFCNFLCLFSFIYSSWFINFFKLEVIKLFLCSVVIIQHVYAWVLPEIDVMKGISAAGVDSNCHGYFSHTDHVIPCVEQGTQKFTMQFLSAKD